MTKMVTLAAALASVTWVQTARHGATTTQAPELSLRIRDFAAMPITGSIDGAGNNAGSLARINVLREEPSPAGRYFVNDLNGRLYILDRHTKQPVTYLDFNGRGSHQGLFDKLSTEAGLASGFISFEFDPDYARNGRFYTIHLEEIAAAGSPIPDNTSVPGLRSAGYAATAPIPTPGPRSTPCARTRLATASTTTASGQRSGARPSC